MSFNAQRWFLASLMILVALVSRFLPHPPNFTALGAMALFSPILLCKTTNSKIAGVVLPLLVLFVSDLFFGFYPGLSFVYLGFAVVAVMAMFVQPSRSWGRLALAVPASSLIFFAISNFGVWALSGMYQQNAAGFIETYMMALPFLGNQLLGDVVFGAAFFAALRYLPLTAAQVTGVAASGSALTGADVSSATSQRRD